MLSIDPKCRDGQGDPVVPPCGYPHIVWRLTYLPIMLPCVIQLSQFPTCCSIRFTM
jgi:hypothetical protein